MLFFDLSHLNSESGKSFRMEKLEGNSWNIREKDPLNAAIDIKYSHIYPYRT